MRHPLLRTLLLAPLALVLTVPSLAYSPEEVVGKWSLDQEKSKSSPDGNTAGLMKTVEIRKDGTFVALYGTKGTWTLKEGTLLVTYANGYRSDEKAQESGEFLKFPSPANAGKFCYLKKTP